MSFQQQVCAQFIGDIESEPSRDKRMQLRKMESKFKSAFKGYDLSQVSIVKLSNHCVEGYTHDGAHFCWYVNSGYNERSRICGRLMLKGQCIFTSGTIAKLVPYIAKKLNPQD